MEGRLVLVLFVGLALTEYGLNVQARNCNPICPGVYYPRCASDRNTYANSCVMRYVTCISNGRVTLAYVGECRPKCSLICTQEYNPQCGSNGRTYANPCAMRGAICMSNGKITLAYPGECRNRNSSNIDCELVNESIDTIIFGRTR